jgi:hypothetical protein
MISTLIASRDELNQQIAREQHEQAMAEWQQAKANARAAKAEVGRLRQVFQKAEAEWMAFERECAKVYTSLQEHLAAKPNDDDFPTIREINNWKQKRDRLEKLLTVTMYAKRSDLATVKEHARIDVIKADQQFVLLGYAERNARTKAQGTQAMEIGRVGL